MGSVFLRGETSRRVRRPRRDDPGGGRLSPSESTERQSSGTSGVRGSRAFSGVFPAGSHLLAGVCSPTAYGYRLHASPGAGRPCRFPRPTAPDFLSRGGRSFSSEGLRPSDSPTRFRLRAKRSGETSPKLEERRRALARRFAGSRRSRGSFPPPPRLRRTRRSASGAKAGAALIRIASVTCVPRPRPRQLAVAPIGSLPTDRCAKLFVSVRPVFS
jgi:hypothetical protein